MTEADPAERLWRRADYVLRGDYCPLPAVLNHLRRIKTTLASDAIIHIAHDHELVMRSLSWCLTSANDKPEGVSAWIRSADYRSVNVIPNRLVLAAAKAGADQPVQFLNAKDATTLATALLAISNPDQKRPHAEIAWLTGQDWTGLLLNHTGKPGHEPWDGEVRSILLLNPPLPEGTCPTDEDRVLQDLGVMLKCTAEANARRDSVVMKKVATELSKFDRIAEYTYEDMARDALRLACDLTGSSGGAVYSLTTERDLAFRRVTKRSDHDFDYPDIVPFSPGDMLVEASNTLSWAVAKRRAYQQISGSLAGKSIARAVKAGGGIELVTPIAGPLVNSWGPAVGAITLFHRRGDPRGYGAYERALVRNISLRLALARTNLATREIATAISTLRTVSPQRLQVDHDRPAHAGSTRWPRDIELTLARLADPLRRLADSTHSHSVTLRIALPDPNSSDATGLGLFRVAAHPPERLGDSYPVLQPDDPGLHWTVLRTGTEEYASRIRNDDSRFPELRSGTRSILCAPVKVDGILAGTLNLESPFVDNYAPFLPLIIALSGALGRTLADARAQLEGDLLGKAAHALDRRHGSSRDLTSIRRRLESMPGSREKTLLLEQASRMQALVKDLRSKTPRRLEVNTLGQLIDAAIHARSIRMHGHLRRRPHAFDRLLDERACVCIMTILDSVMYNLNRHSSLDAYDLNMRSMPRIAYRAAQFQAVEQAVITIESLSANYLDEKLVRQMYRYPVATPDDELRLGTYIAGINARRVGGRVHASILDEGRILRTNLMIPITPLMKHLTD